MPWTPEPRWNERRNRWYVTLRGKQYVLARGHENKHQAWEKFNRIRSEIYATDPPGDPRTMQQLIKRFLKLYPSAKNATLLKDWDFFCERPLAKLDNDCLIKYVAYLKDQGNGAWTIKAKIGVAKRVLDWGYQHEHHNARVIRPKLDKPPAGHRDIPRKKLPQLLQKMNTPRRERTATIVRFILATGCRPGEARKLRWDHIDLDEHEARLPHTEHKTGKATGEERMIYLNDDALAALAEAQRRDGRRGVVFRNNRGRPFPKGGIY